MWNIQLAAIDMGIDQSIEVVKIRNEKSDRQSQPHGDVSSIPLSWININYYN